MSTQGDRCAHVRGDHLRVAADTVLLTDKALKLVVELGTSREEESRARGEGVEEVELLLLALSAMVTRLSLLHLRLPLLELQGG